MTFWRWYWWLLYGWVWTWCREDRHAFSGWWWWLAGKRQPMHSTRWVEWTWKKNIQNGKTLFCHLIMKQKRQSCDSSRLNVKEEIHVWPWMDRQTQVQKMSSHGNENNCTNGRQLRGRPFEGKNVVVIQYLLVLNTALLNQGKQRSGRIKRREKPFLALKG